MKTWALQMLTLMYPATCRYCHKSLEDPFQYLCNLCQGHLCICEDSSSEDLYCFEKPSPVEALLLAAETTSNQRLEKHLAAWLAYRMIKAKCAMPDLVVPAIQQGIFCRSSLNVALAKALARYMHVTYAELFYFQLAPEVYNQEGKLLGSTALKRYSKQRRYANKRLCIVSAHGQISGYSQLLEQAGIASMMSVSLLKPLAGAL